MLFFYLSNDVKFLLRLKAECRFNNCTFLPLKISSQYFMDAAFTKYSLAYTTITNQNLALKNLRILT